MPITLDSTRALRGEKRKWTLVVMGHGRTEYRRKAIDAVDKVIGLKFFDRRIISTDGSAVIPDNTTWPQPWEPVWTEIGKRHGLTANMAQALGALTDEDEWVFWLEEDFVVHDAPLDEMADTLDAYRHVANMALVRQPWSAEEHAAGGLLFGSHIQGDVIDRGGWLEHRKIFTLNPFVAHASLLRSLTPAVENSLTNQCLLRGLSFGFWGGLHDEPRVEHIGVEGGMGSPGWRP